LDQSTTHVFGGAVGARHVGTWLQFAVALAPPGFDEARDGVCLHQSGTVLYLSPAMPRLLGFRHPAPWVGCRLIDLVHPDDRSRVASVLERGRDESPPVPEQATLLSPSHGGAGVALTALHRVGSTPPVDILYVCPATDSTSSGGGASAASGSGERQGQRLARPTVLICDDEARLGALTAGLLNEFGFAPIAVGTGDDALRTLAAGRPGVDVMLLDVNLSAGRSAGEVLAEMGATGARAPVILTSGMAEEDVDPDLMAHPSVVGYIAKPYGVDQLVQSINRALHRPGA
jgi:CheY-like chemotaxis protein